MHAPPCARLLGWHLLDARPREGWIRIGFDGKADFCNPAGFVQGGILSAMLDDTMGPAVFVMTEGKLYTATITMTVNFLAPAKPGPIIGEANVTQLGKTVAFVEGRLMAEDGTRARHRHDAARGWSRRRRRFDSAWLFSFPFFTGEVKISACRNRASAGIGRSAAWR